MNLFVKGKVSNIRELEVSFSVDDWLVSELWGWQKRNVQFFFSG